MYIMKKAPATIMLSSIFLLVLTINGHICQGTTPPGNTAKQKSILVLGGNGFLGSHTVNALLEDGSYNVTIVNRGNIYFNSNKEINLFVDRVIVCDRNTLVRSECKELLEKNPEKKQAKEQSEKNLPSTWYDVVVDFSSYQDQQIEQMIDILKNRVGLYIFISSDAVYDVSGKSHGGKTREEDSKTEIKDKKKREELENGIIYGKHKKECEERLIIQREKFGFPYLILRLADAMGEKDTTYRWWIYQIWMKMHPLLKLPVPLPEGIRKHTFGMVYAKDVANAIVDVLQEPSLFNDQILNLAFKEEITLEKILSSMATFYGIAANVTYNTDDETAWFKYPSTQRGPLDTTNAEILMEWSPTDFQTAVNNTCTFFENAMVDPRYSKDRELVLAEFIEETLPDSFSDEDLLINSLVKAYSPAVFKGIDIGFAFDETQNLIESTTTGKSEL